MERTRSGGARLLAAHCLPPLVAFIFLLACIGPAYALTIPAIAPDGSAEEIPAAAFKPDGPGPFPAVVILHDCSGLGPVSSGAPGRWARELVGRGYFVLVPDSFTTRGHAGGVCTDPSPTRADVSPYRRVRDAYAALAYVRTLPYVDGRRVGLMGGSHGGLATLASMAAPESDAEPLARNRRAGFAAAVALYPACASTLGGWRANLSGVYSPVAPVLILVGEKDDWTPAEPCRKLAEAARRAGYPVAIKVYPGAHHSFDSHYPVRYVAARVNANAPGRRGATTGGDPDAWADSIREIAAFFGRHLVQMENRSPDANKRLVAPVEALPNR
jgi:dienelactone hydrolase